MLYEPFDNFEHVLCGLLLFSRLVDIFTTWLVTPRMLLETNPIMRKLGWRFAVLTVLICPIPYFHAPAAVMILVPSLIVAGNNAAKVWMLRTYGEAEYLKLMLGLVRKSSRFNAVAGALIAAAIFFLLGGLVVVFYPDPDSDWGFWIGMGIATYGLILGLYYTLYMLHLFKKVGKAVRPEDEAGGGYEV